MRCVYEDHDLSQKSGGPVWTAIRAICFASYRDSPIEERKEGAGQLPPLRLTFHVGRHEHHTEVKVSRRGKSDPSQIRLLLPLGFPNRRGFSESEEDDLFAGLGADVMM